MNQSDLPYYRPAVDEIGILMAAADEATVIAREAGVLMLVVRRIGDLAAALRPDIGDKDGARPPRACLSRRRISLRAASTKRSRATCVSTHHCHMAGIRRSAPCANTGER